MQNTSMPTATAHRNVVPPAGPGASRVGLVGAPGEAGAAAPGAALGPAALRAAGLADVLAGAGRPVHDRGDVIGPPRPDRPAIAGHRHLAEALAWCRGVRDAVTAALADDECPLLLGGDHSLAIGSIAAVAAHCAATERPLCVLWLDAHADFNTAATSPTGNIHGMPLAVLCGEGHPDLLALGHATPIVDPRGVFPVGVRAVDALEQGNLDERPVAVHDMRDIRERGPEGVIGDILAAVARIDGHLHVSLDLDFIDPADAPGVGTPEAGGPRAGEALACMERIRESRLLGSLDLVELDPGRDRDGRTARLAIDLVARLLDPPVMARTG